MNDLGTRILEVLEGSPLGDMSIHILNKQSNDMELDLDRVSKQDILPLVERLNDVLPFFLGDDTGSVLIDIRKIASNEVTVS